MLPACCALTTFDVCLSLYCYQVSQQAWCSRQPWSPLLASPHPYWPSMCQSCCVTGPRDWLILARSQWPFAPVCGGVCRQRIKGDQRTRDGRNTWFVCQCHPPLRHSYSVWSPYCRCWLVLPHSWVGVTAFFWNAIMCCLRISGWALVDTSRYLYGASQSVSAKHNAVIRMPLTSWQNHF